jgi:hypothetical protein
MKSGLDEMKTMKLGIGLFAAAITVALYSHSHVGAAASQAHGLVYLQNPLYASINRPITSDVLSGHLSGDISFSITPSLPPGIQLDSHNGTITGRATAQLSMSRYVVSATTSTGTVQTNFYLTITPHQLATNAIRQGYIGNSMPGASTQNISIRNYVPNFVDGMFVRPDGLVLINSSYDEGGNEAAAYRNGSFAYTLKDLHGWGRMGGSAIIADSRYTFLAMSQAGGFHKRGAPKGFCDRYYAIRRYDNQGNPAPYTSLSTDNYRDESGWDGSMLTISKDVQESDNIGRRTKKCGRLISDGGALVQQGHPVTGAALADGTLYVSDYAGKRIRAYDEVTMLEKPHASFSTDSQAHPQALVADSDHQILWSIEGSDAVNDHKSIVAYSLRTGHSGKKISVHMSGYHSPISLALDPSNRFLLVTDDSPSAQQVYIYQIAVHEDGIDASLINSIGQRGGQLSVGAGGSAATPRFYGPTGAGIDAPGHLYVASNGHSLSRDADTTYTNDTKHFALIERYALTGIRDSHPHLQYAYQSWPYIDNVAFSGNHMYSKYQAFTTASVLGEAGQLQATRVADTFNPIRYPNDFRYKQKRAGIWARHIAGRDYLFMSAQFATVGLAIYRMDAGKGIPSGYISISGRSDRAQETFMPSGTWMWTDNAGRGEFDASEVSLAEQGERIAPVWAWNTDTKGDIWAVPETPQRATHEFQAFHFRLTSIDKNGVLRYSPFEQAKEDSSILGTIFTRVERFVYSSETDTAYVSGYGLSDEEYKADWGLLGTTLASYAHWSDPNRRALRWVTQIPYKLALPNVWDPRNAPATYPKSLAVTNDYIFLVDTSPARLSILSALTGESLMEPIMPNNIYGGAMMLTDIPYAVQADRRLNGDTWVTVEEDDRGKNMLYIVPSSVH